MTVATLGQHPRFWEIICFASYASFFAGFVNGIFLITFATFVSSVNGVLSLVALQYLSVGSAIKGSILLAQIVTFFFGGICAGFFFDEQLVVSPQLALGGLGVCLGVFVTVAVFSVGTEAAKQASVFVAAFSMGLQNAMGSFFSKGVLRTTHQSGAVTDLGIFVGQWLQLRCCARSKLKPPEYWRVRAQLPVLLAYFLGGFCGVAAVANGSFLWMLLPCACQALFLIVYLLHHFCFKKSGLSDAADQQLVIA